MPTYEYRCPQGHEFETLQKMSDPPVAPCPECGTEAERLLSTGAGFLFKGSGFYITDYRSDAYREQARKESSAFSGSRASGEGGAAPENGKEGSPKKEAAADAGTGGSPAATPKGKKAQGSQDAAGSKTSPSD